MSHQAAVGRLCDVSKMTADEYKAFRRKEHRRALGRKNQERYRIRKRLEEQETMNRIQELRERLKQITRYNTILIRREYLNPSAMDEMRRMVVELFSDYFKNGVDSTTAAAAPLFMKQQTFLKSHFSENLVYQSVEYLRGYRTLVQQLELFTMLHSDLRMKKTSIESPLDGDVFRLGFKLDTKISHHTITILYPQMLDDFAFFQQVIGAPIAFNGTMTFYFGPDNAQVERITCELDLATGWCALVKNIDVTRRVLTTTAIHDNYIVLDYQQIRAKLAPARCAIQQY